jgi:hypothetical protein
MDKLYENGGVTATSQRNSTNAEKAKAYDDLVEAKKNEDNFTQGNEAAYAEVNQILEQARQQQAPQPAPGMFQRAGTYLSEAADGLANYMTDAVVGENQYTRQRDSELGAQMQAEMETADAEAILNRNSQ